MTPAPKRHWFRFSLRTLFVTVTALGLLFGWLAWNVQWVNERQRLLGWADDIHISHGILGVVRNSPPRRLPIMWRLLGAQRIDVFTFDKAVPISDQEQLKAAFPEAIVVDYTKIFQSPPYTWPVREISDSPR